MIPKGTLKQITSVRRKCNLGISVHRIITAMAVYFTLAGLGVLVIRLSLPEAAEYVWLGLAGVFIPLLLGILQARRTWYSNDDVLGMCDRDGDCRGLLLTLGECDHPAWERLLKESLQSERLPIPQLSFRDTASCLPFLCFFTFACLVPQNFNRILTPQLSLFQFQELESLQDTVEYIEDEELIPEEEIEAIKAELERMKQHRERNSDSSWESLDTLKERIATNLEETRQALAGAEEDVPEGVRAS